MDGYVFKFVDVKDCSLENFIFLEIVEEIFVGFKF